MAEKMANFIFSWNTTIQELVTRKIPRFIRENEIKSSDVQQCKKDAGKQSIGVKWL